ncbi:MAG: hypothetical protein AB7V50_08005, partial [Vampirovibrionia bacterium]
MSDSSKNINNEINRPSEVSSLLSYLLSQPDWLREYYSYQLRMIKNYGINEEPKRQLFIYSYKPQPAENFSILKKQKFETNFIKLNVHQVVFLECVDNNKSIVEICCDKQWSLYKCCDLFLSLITKEILKPPEDKRILLLVDYILGHITLDEYLVRSKRVSIKQLDNALYAVKRAFEGMGKIIPIQDMLVKMRYVTLEEINDLFCLFNTSNQECRMSDQTLELEIQIDSLQKQVARLKLENAKLIDEKTTTQDILM